MPYLGELLALASACFFGGSVVYMRLGLMQGNRDMGMLVTLLVNNLINLVMMSIWFLLDLIPPLNFWGLAFFGLSGFLTSNLGRFLQTISMENIGASRTSTFKVASPIFTILIGVFLLNEKISLPAFSGMGIVMLGLLIVTLSMKDQARVNQEEELKQTELAAAKGKKPSEGAGRLTAVKKGVAFGFLSGLSFSLGQIFRKVGVKAIPSSVVGVTIGSVIALLCFSFMLYLKLGIRGLKEQLIINYHHYYLISGIFSSLALYSFFLSLQFTTVSKANILMSTEVLITVIFGYFILGKTENINQKMIMGAVAVFSGLILIILF